MILYINTSLVDSLEVRIENDKKVIAKKTVKAKRQQAEKLLVTIEDVLKKAKLKLCDIAEIKVVNYGGTFTGLRIGVLTANALAYALQIPVNSYQKSKQKIKKYSKNQLVEAIYDREPSIGKKSNCG